MIDDLKAGAPKHRLRAGAVRNPPIRRIARVSFFDKIHPVVDPEPDQPGEPDGEGEDRLTAEPQRQQPAVLAKATPDLLSDLS